MMKENVFTIKKKKKRKKGLKISIFLTLLDSEIEYELCKEALRTIHVMWRYALATQLFLDFFPLFR